MHVLKLPPRISAIPAPPLDPQAFIGATLTSISVSDCPPVQGQPSSMCALIHSSSFTQGQCSSEVPFFFLQHHFFLLRWIFLINAQTYCYFSYLKKSLNHAFSSSSPRLPSFPGAKFLEKLTCAYCHKGVSSRSVLKSFCFHISCPPSPALLFLQPPALPMLLKPMAFFTPRFLNDHQYFTLLTAFSSLNAFEHGSVRHTPTWLATTF